jgi:hypothetical protein
MSETAKPNSSAIADAMLKRTGEILREQNDAFPALKPLTEKVVDALTSIGQMVCTVGDRKSLDSLTEQLKAAIELGKGRPAPILRLASYFANESPEGMTPHYVEVAEEFRGDPDVHPLYFGPADPRAVERSERITPERISELWNGMPGGYEGFLKQWGYQQFAQVVEAEVRATLCAGPSPTTVSDEPPPCNQPNGLTPESLAEEMFDAAIHYSNGYVTDFRERAEDILAREGTATR